MHFQGFWGQNRVKASELLKTESPSWTHVGGKCFLVTPAAAVTAMPRLHPLHVPSTALACVFCNSSCPYGPCCCRHQWRLKLFNDGTDGSLQCCFDDELDNASVAVSDSLTVPGPSVPGSSVPDSYCGAVETVDRSEASVSDSGQRQCKRRRTQR